jgi:BASS family bile acid:Na+ symporter
VILVFAALAMMDGVTARLLAEPMTVALFLAAAVVFNVGFQALGALVYWRRGRRAALSMGLALGNRNMALMLVLAGGLLGPDLALYVAMAQIPVYLLPLVAKPLYGRLL